MSSEEYVHDKNAQMSDAPVQDNCPDYRVMMKERQGEIKRKCRTTVENNPEKDTKRSATENRLHWRMQQLHVKNLFGDTEGVSGVQC